MWSEFKKDYERFTPHKFYWIPCFIRMFRNHELRFIFWGRLNQNTSSLLIKQVSYYFLHKYRKKYGIELNFEKCGAGIRLVHPWCITVNDNCLIGRNVTLYKGCTIGSIDVGRNSGCPVLGDEVTIYANATVCGGVTIGRGVKIAAGSFVDFNVPEGATVVGNPGKIYKH